MTDAVPASNVPDTAMAERLREEVRQLQLKTIVRFELSRRSTRDQEMDDYHVLTSLRKIADGQPATALTKGERGALARASQLIARYRAIAEAEVTPDKPSDHPLPGFVSEHFKKRVPEFQQLLDETANLAGELTALAGQLGIEQEAPTPPAGARVR